MLSINHQYVPADDFLGEKVHPTVLGTSVLSVKVNAVLLQPCRYQGGEEV
jgi:hypothetical protein